MNNGYSPILVPVVALVAWSLVMLLWLVITRGSAMKAAGISLAGARGSRGSDFDGVLAPEAQWKSHNYNHLMEQPTLFYAICLALALLGAGGGINFALAMGYVVLRVIHSLVQATVNIVMIRFALFILSSLCLIALTVNAVMLLLARDSIL